MHNILKRGITLFSKSPHSINKYSLKSTVSSWNKNSTATPIKYIQGQPVSYNFSSVPPKYNGSGYQNKYENNQNYKNEQRTQDKEPQRSSATTQQNSQQSGRFFYSHTKMSSHYVIRVEEIYELLNKFNLQYKQGQNEQQLQIEWCPFCAKPHNNEMSNSYTLGLKKSTGQFNCFRCGIKGSWWDFKNILYKNISISDFKSFNETFSQEERMDDSEYYLYHSQLFDKENFKEELDYLCGKSSSNQRHINFETLVKYKVGIGKEEFINRDGDYIKVPVVYFPMFKFEELKAESSDEDKVRDVFKEEEEEQQQSQSQQRITISTSTCKLVKCKIRGVGSENKKYMRMKPSGSKSNFIVDAILTIYFAGVRLHFV